MRTIINAINGIKNDIKGKSLVIVSRMVTRALHVVTQTRSLFTHLLGRAFPHYATVTVCVADAAAGRAARAGLRRLPMQRCLGWRPGWERIRISSQSW